MLEIQREPSDCVSSFNVITVRNKLLNTTKEIKIIHLSNVLLVLFLCNVKSVHNKKYFILLFSATRLQNNQTKWKK